MRRRYNETAEQAAERFIQERREAAALFPALRRVFLAFDGKMYNKRFDTALKEIPGSIYCQKRDHNLDIYLYNDSNDIITLCWYKLPEDKRINAADIIQKAAEKRSELLSEAYHMQEIMPTIQARRDQIEHVKKLLSGIISDLSYTEQELFDLHYSINRRS